MTAFLRPREPLALSEAEGKEGSEEMLGSEQLQNSNRGNNSHEVHEELHRLPEVFLSYPL